MKIIQNVFVPVNQYPKVGFIKLTVPYFRKINSYPCAVQLRWQDPGAQGELAASPSGGDPVQDCPQGSQFDARS